MSPSRLAMVARVALVLVLLGTATAHADEAVELVPTLRIDSAERVERGGAWRFRAPAREDVERIATEPRQVVFLMDVSRSMPYVLGQESRFEDVVTDVVARARAMLAPYADRDALEISLYRFGDLVAREGEWQPYIEPFDGAVDVGVGEATATLSGFVSSDSAVYDDAWTYVAASVFEAARVELGATLDEPLSAAGDTPVFFVFTDAGDPALGGGESHARGRAFDNSPYTAWLEREIGAARLEYHYWNLATDDLGTIAPPARETFRVSWPEAGRLDVVNRGMGAGTPADGHRILAASEAITLSPQMALSQGEVAGCLARIDDDILGIPLRDLRLIRSEPATFALGALDTYPVGAHRVSYEPERLCDELRRVYPNTDFIIPDEASLGFLEVIEQREHVLIFDGLDAPLDAAWDPVRVDRFHVYRGFSRRVAAEVPTMAGVEVLTQWTVRTLLEGAWRTGLVQLRTEDGLAGESVEVRGSAPVTVELAAWDAPFWAATPLLGMLWGGPPVAVDGGSWTVELCANLTVASLPDPGDRARLVACPSCAETYAFEDGRTCFLSSVEVSPRPWHWLWILLTTLTIVWLLVQVMHVLRWLQRMDPALAFEWGDGGQHVPMFGKNLGDRVLYALVHKQPELDPRRETAGFYFEIRGRHLRRVTLATNGVGLRGGVWRLFRSKHSRPVSLSSLKPDYESLFVVVPGAAGIRPQLRALCGDLQVRGNKNGPIREGASRLVDVTDRVSQASSDGAAIDEFQIVTYRDSQFTKST